MLWACAATPNSLGSVGSSDSADVYPYPSSGRCADSSRTTDQISERPVAPVISSAFPDRDSSAKISSEKPIRMIPPITAAVRLRTILNPVSPRQTYANQTATAIAIIELRLLLRTRHSSALGIRAMASHRPHLSNER